MQRGVFPNTLPLPDGTQETSFVFGDNSPAYICIDGFSTCVGDFGRMKAYFTLMCSANGMFEGTQSCVDVDGCLDDDCGVHGDC